MTLQDIDYHDRSGWNKYCKQIDSMLVIREPPKALRRLPRALNKSFLDALITPVLPYQNHAAAAGAETPAIKGVDSITQI